MATAMKSVRRTTGTRAMKRYETMSFVRMRQSRRSETQRKPRQASHTAKSERTTRAGPPIAPGRARPASESSPSRSHTARATATTRPGQVAVKKVPTRARSPRAGGRGPSGSSGCMREPNLAPPRFR